MAHTELLMRMRDLHNELVKINDDLRLADRVDEDTVDALGQLVTDVGGLVERANQSVDPEPTPQEHHDLNERISDWENRHPKVTQFLSQVTDVLAMIGI